MSSPANDKPKSDYILRMIFAGWDWVMVADNFYRAGRDLIGRVRYQLHPAVNSNKEGLHVADLATGSGIWLFDIAPSFPPSTQFHGFDISLDQVPPRNELIPDNFHFSELDLTKDVPPELHGRFDVVNIRYLILVAKNGPDHILRQAFKMLKPGGWLQWTEHEFEDETPETIYRTDPGTTPTAMPKIYAVLKRMQPSIWVGKLDEHFASAGFEKPVMDVKYFRDAPLWAPFLSDSVTLAFAEMVNMYPDGPERADYIDLYNRTVDESWAGNYWSSKRVNVVGRKPL